MSLLPLALAVSLPPSLCRRDRSYSSPLAGRVCNSRSAWIPRWKQRCVVTLIVFAAPLFAFAKQGHVKQTIYADGEPAKHALVSLYNCNDGGLYRGPIATDDNGSVTFNDVADGDYCERTDIAAGYASKRVHIDTTILNQRVDLTEVVPPLNLPDRGFPLVFCVLTVLLVIYPIGRFLAKPWAFRRDTLIGQLSGDSMVRYYKQFRSGELIPIGCAGKNQPESKPVGDHALQVSDYEKAFSHDFNKWYGRRYYIAPVIGLATLASACAWWGCVNLWRWISGLRSVESMKGLVGAAIAGAFVWIISDEIDRLRRRDFTSSDVYYYVFRLLLAVPFAWALTRAEVTLQVGIPVAFFLGALPTTALFTAARRIANQQLRLGDDPISGILELEKLQNIGKQGAERFKDEGISTISQLAYADPVDLTIRTNFDFNYVTDCVSQALLWIYFGECQHYLTIFSLRGAYEANCLMEDLGSADAVCAANARQVLTDIAALLVSCKVQISTQALQITLGQAAYDPYTEFLVDIWK